MQDVGRAVLCLTLGALAGVHFYWAGGGRRGVDAAIPTTRDGAKLFEPGPVGCAVVGTLLLAGALVPLALPEPWPRQAALRAMSVVFALRAMGDFRYVGVGKRVRTTTFARWDTRLYTSLCLVIATLAWRVAR